MADTVINYINEMVENTVNFMFLDMFGLPHSTKAEMEASLAYLDAKFPPVAAKAAPVDSYGNKLGEEIHANMGAMAIISQTSQAAVDAFNAFIGGSEKRADSLTDDSIEASVREAMINIFLPVIESHNVITD